MATTSYSNLKKTESAWNSALRKFSIVTVMNAKVFDVYDGMTMKELEGHTAAGTFTATQLAALYEMNPAFVTRTGDETYTYTLNDNARIDFSILKVNEIIALYLMTQPAAELKYLKTANTNQEGPTKTVTGGQSNSPLVKYGKTARLEMTDALGNAEALERLTGLTVEYFRTAKATDADLKVGATDVIHATTLYAGHQTIIGETFLLDANTGNQVEAYIVYYDFLPDSLINLTQDAEGDATVFDMNGDLIPVDILIGDDAPSQSGSKRQSFYTIVPKLDYATDFDEIVDKGLSD